MHTAQDKIAPSSTPIIFPGDHYKLGSMMLLPISTTIRTPPREERSQLSISTPNPLQQSPNPPRVLRPPRLCPHGLRQPHFLYHQLKSTGFQPQLRHPYPSCQRLQTSPHRRLKATRLLLAPRGLEAIRIRDLTHPTLSPPRLLDSKPLPCPAQHRLKRIWSRRYKTLTFAIFLLVLPSSTKRS